MRRLSLRWRLVLAFLAVSVIPVLLASYIAASTIEAAFRHNIENWLQETVRFLSGETKETSDEAEKAAAIIAAALQTRMEAGVTARDAVEPFGRLLISTGYDLVRVFDTSGHAVFSLGEAEIEGQPVLHDGASISIGHLRNRDRLLIGAVRGFTAGSQRYFVFVANLIDRNLFGFSHSLSSISLHVYRLAGREPATVVADGAAMTHNQIPASVINALSSGADSAVYTNAAHSSIISYAPLRGSQGQLLGIIACRLSATADLYERLGRWGLFLLLAALAGFISFLTALLVAGRIARPVRNLTSGVRNVTQGLYETEVAEEGGREIADLAHGFNVMVARLRRLNAMEAEMRRQQQLAALGEAAAVIAHEIRNPLGIIRTSSEVVRLKSQLAPSEDRLLGFVLDEVRRIDRLVADILDYVRPKQRRSEKLDPADVVGRAAEALAPAMAARGVRVEQHFEPGLKIDGDPDQLHQVMLNLFLNAIDAMPEGGCVSVRGEREAESLRMTISDTGTGIEPEAIDRVFDPFFTTKARGTGLGLAKVQAIVREHGGSVDVTSSPAGTSFNLSLPLAQQLPSTHAAR